MKASPYDHVFEVFTMEFSGVKMSRCKVCGGSPEKNLGNDMMVVKTLATHCPGQWMTTEQLSAVGDTLDFRDGKWVTLIPAAS